MLNTKQFILLFTFVCLFSTANIFAQTTGFVYQGKLSDGAQAANGTYQFEFKLFDAASGGNQVGQTISNLPATVANGIFAVNLDFGASSFDGSPRYLEISVRLNNSGQGYTLLTPRQAVTSTPYAVRSLNANQAETANNSANLGGIPAAQYTQTTDPRLSDDRNPLPNSPNYIQNTASQQASSNFNISGTGKANVLDSATVYKIGGARVLSNAGADNLFAGVQSGNANTGGFNAFFGAQTGKSNTSGFNNTFVGAYAGRDNTTGANNAFFGANAGLGNLTGAGNSFFGANAGLSNSNGAGNSFFGNGAGLNNNASGNSFFGTAAGQANTTGANNAFFGFNSGLNNLDGISNSFFGASSGKANTTGDNNAFFGNNSGTGNTTGSNNSFFGNASGQSNTTGGSNVFVGTNTGLLNTTGSFNTFVGRNSATLNSTGANNTFLGYNAGGAITTGNDNVFLGSNAGSTVNVFNSIAIGSGVKVTSSNTALIGNNAMSVIMPGSLDIGKTLDVVGDATFSGKGIFGGNLNVTGSGVFSGTVSGATGQFSQLNASQFLSNGAVMNGVSHITTIVYGNINGAGGESDFMCRTEDTYILLPCFGFSNLDAKNTTSFTGGFNLLKDLRAVSYSPAGETRRSLGLVLNDAANTNSVFARPSAGRFVTGTRYFDVVAALVDTAQQQQTQIEAQTAENQKLQAQLKQVQSELEALKAIVCAQSGAAVCQPK